MPDGPAGDGLPDEHFFTADPRSPSRPRDIRVVVDGEALHLSSDSSVFSRDHLDPGTAVLLTKAPRPPAAGTLLDLGCGYGVIACALAKRSPGATVLAVDVNTRALDLTRANASRLGLTNVVVAPPHEVPDEPRLAAIYSNPPIHAGKAVLHELLLRWLPRLAVGARAYLVVHRHLGADSLQRWLEQTGYPSDRLVSVRGYRVLAVHAAGVAGVGGARMPTP